MKVLIIDRETTQALLSMETCIPLMEDAFRSLAGGRVIQPLRLSMRLPRGDILASMPAYDGATRALGAKIISVFPGNHGTGHDAHQGAVLLYDADNGSLMAIVDGTAITGIRTAAVSASATKALANPDSSTLGILGAGTQARAHLEAIRILYDLESVAVWSVLPEEAEAFARRESIRTGLTVRAVRTAEEAVSEKRIVCTTTAAVRPILLGRWISPGTHINAVGACTPTARELDTDAVRRSRLFVDRMESALGEAGDIIIPMEEGAMDRSHIAGELGDLLTGKLRGRTSEDEITLFKSLGLAMEDLVCARYIHDRAKAGGVGVEVEFGGRPSPEIEADGRIAAGERSGGHAGGSTP